MKRLSLALMHVVVCAAALAGCTKKAKEAEAPKAAEPGKPAGEQVVNLFIWPNYTSTKLLDEFTKRTGIKVVESNYASNEELLAKLQAGATGFDIAVPSDYMVSVMSKLDLLEPLDRSKLPNWQNLDPQFLGKPYDPDNKVSVPYGWTITGLAVNRELYKDSVTSWADLLRNPKVAGKAAMLDDVREAVGAALKLDGHSLNSTDPAELKQARDVLVAAKKAIKAFNSSPIDLITNGELQIAQMYSGEALVAARDNGGKVDFVIPKEGGTMAIDNLVLLKSAPHKEAALALINFMLETASNVDLVTRVLSGPVLKDTRAQLPKALQDNPSLFPPADVLARCEMMQDLGEATAKYDRIWSEVKVSR